MCGIETAVTVLLVYAAVVAGYQIHKILPKIIILRFMSGVFVRHPLFFVAYLNLFLPKFAVFGIMQARHGKI